ncbi:MAG: DUF2752 domain-containing protein [bacterium]|nr:DUF2752 domain-containing protein [bacterium]
MKLIVLQRKKGELNLPLIYGAIALLLGVMAYMLHLQNRMPLMRCPFKAFTGIPCPTCGSTRLVQGIFSADLPTAFAFNPLLFLTGFALIAWVVYGVTMLFYRRRLQLVLSPKEGLVFRLGIVAVFLVNWVYLIAAGV